MSVPMLQQVLASSAVAGAKKAVLINLAWHAWDNGREARPSLGTIAGEMGLTERTVRRALRDLEAAGLIAVDRVADRARHLPTCYRIAMPPEDGVTPGAGGQHASRPGDTVAPKRQTKTSLKRDGGARRAASNALEKY